MEFIGYRPLRAGRIHLWCPECHRKMSNVPRTDVDPPRAALAHVLCPRCADTLGVKDDSASYLDRNGKRVPWDEGVER
jgi:hypothetical protein